jgi:hypothetical protein
VSNVSHSLKLKVLSMTNDLYLKRNERKINVLYPVHGSRNVLRKVVGVKLASFTGPSGRGIKVRLTDGTVRSLSLSKCVASL